ncbi:MAG: hypothetical protein J0G30_07205 [Actinomycetales bacterium]|nr:hypothetical protein [Actinomycetales bacterium]
MWPFVIGMVALTAIGFWLIISPRSAWLFMRMWTVDGPVDAREPAARSFSIARLVGVGLLLIPAATLTGILLHPVQIVSHWPH